MKTSRSILMSCPRLSDRVITVPNQVALKSQGVVGLFKTAITWTKAMNLITKPIRAGLILTLTFLLTAAPLIGQETIKPKPKVDTGPPAGSKPSPGPSRRRTGSGSQSSAAPTTSRNSTAIQFVRVTAGSFLMGSNDSDVARAVSMFQQAYDWFKTEYLRGETPQHRVTISRSFEMGKYEVTQGQWESVMGPDTNPSEFKGSSLPVTNVSWDDIQYFLEKLNQKGDGYEYRLPTEAEWEYACRAGSSGDYAGYFEGMAWYADNSGTSRFDSVSTLRSKSDYTAALKRNGNQPHPVGTKQPNTWGLYDMYGNVWEWCSDWYVDYPSYSVTDPTGPSTGSARVYRGGSCYNTAVYCRSALRNRFLPGIRVDNLGFRLVRVRK